MSKKILIPMVLGAILLIGIVFSVVYKQTSKDPYEQPVIETLPPKETEEIKVKVDSTEKVIDDFDFEVKEPPKAIITGEDGKVLTEEEAQAYEESIAKSMILETQMVDGEEVIVDANGNEIGAEDDNDDSQKIIDGKEMEEMQEGIENYTYNQTIERLREFILIQVQKQKEAGNEEFMSITEESIKNASAEEVNELYMKVMSAVGFER